MRPMFPTLLCKSLMFKSDWVEILMSWSICSHSKRPTINQVRMTELEMMMRSNKKISETCLLVLHLEEVTPINIKTQQGIWICLRFMEIGMGLTHICFLRFLHKNQQERMTLIIHDMEGLVLV